jgi:HlyD family secretion protein
MRLRPLNVGQYASLAAVLAVTTVGGYFGYERLAPKPAAAARVVTADVTRGTIVSTVSATGSVAAPAQSKLTFKTNGKLAQLMVAVGDTVQEGQPLARIDDSELQVALVSARASYNSAVAKLEQVKAGAKPEELAQAQAQLDSARLKLDQTRGVTQGPDMAAAQSTLESAKIKLNQLLAGGRPEDVQAAQAQLDTANAKLDALLNPRPEDLAAAQSQLETAKIKLEQLRNPRQEDIRTAQLQLTAAQAKLDALLNPRPEDLAAAQSQVDQAQTKLSQLTDQPRTAKPEDIANAELAVQNAQVAYDKAIAEASTVGRSNTTAGQSGSTSTSTTQASADASVKQALINLQTAQNNLTKIQAQGPTDWDIRLAQQSLEASKANLAKIKNPAPSDVQAAQGQVEQAKVALEKLTNPSAYDIQAAQEGVNQAQLAITKLKNPAPADIQAAQQAVIQAKTSMDKLVSPTDYDIQAAQQAVAQAQTSIDKLLTQNNYDVQTAQLALAQQVASYNVTKAGATAQDILVAQAAVETADAQLKQAESNLAAATLTAPYSGQIAAILLNPGEMVGSNSITLVDTRQLRVDVVVDETDVAKIQKDQAVNVTLEALPGQRIPGKISVVSPVGTVTQGVVNYSVQVQLDPAQAQGVRPGMTATAQVVTAQKDDAVLAPNRAIKTQGRTRTVEVLDAEGKTQSRPVQVGMANDQQSEIVSGLQPGDKVVIPSTTTAANARVPGLTPGGGPGGPGGPGGGPVFVTRGG